MRTVGISGGIGSGKTLVANIFFHLGIPVFNADSEAKIILNNNADVRDHLTSWFGREIYSGSQLDRAKLAGIVFENPDLLSKVNGLVHPKVMERFINWCNDFHDMPYVLHEAAILFESGFYKKMSTSILVTAPEEMRISRVVSRDKTTEEQVRQRMQNQWPDEKKIPLAGYRIQNDGKSPLIPRILEIHNILIA